MSESTETGAGCDPSSSSPSSSSEAHETKEGLSSSVATGGAVVTEPGSSDNSVENSDESMSTSTPSTESAPSMAAPTRIQDVSSSESGSTKTSDEVLAAPTRTSAPPLKKRGHSSLGEGDAKTKTKTPPQKKSKHQDENDGSDEQAEADSSSSAGTSTGDDGSSSSDSSSSRNSSPKKKKSKTKKKKNNIKSGLRKGKWTHEEEEYTTAIIRHFRSGLLRLPEGTTLRGYLADKLNCDPMRITKKYAGAACLGKRSFSFCERLSISDVQVANAQIVHLEQRFKLRLETGHAGIPLPYSSMPSNLPLAGAPFSSASSVASAPSLAPPVAPSLQQHQAPPQMSVPYHNPNTTFGNACSAALSAAPTAAGFAGLPMQVQQQARHAQQQQALNALLANLAPQAFAPSALGQPNLQAAMQATLLPALTTQPQQQQQQSAQLQAHVSTPAPSQPAPAPRQQYQNPLALLLTKSMINQHAVSAAAAEQQPSYQAPLGWAQSHAQTNTSLPPQALSQMLLASLQQKHQGVHGLPSLSGLPPSLSAHRPSLSLGAGMPIPRKGGNTGAAAAAAAASTAAMKSARTMKTSTPNRGKRTDSNQESSRSDSPRTKAEEEAGSALFGFLSALHKNHEEALAKAAAEDEEASKKTNGEETKDSTDAELDPKEANGAAAKSSNSSASGAITINKDSKTETAVLEGAAKNSGKRSTFRTVSSLTDQLSSDSSSASAPASNSKGDSSSEDPKCRAHRVTIKQIGPQFSLPKQCSDISAGIGEGDSPFCTSTSLAAPASVTDCSSGNKTDMSSRGSSENQSSIEGGSQDNSSRDNSSHGDGSDASNKMDGTSSGTSSEEDEKDSRKAKVAARKKSYGAASGEPNAKRQKKAKISDFTSKNVADHNTRMDAMYNRLATMSPALSENKDQ